MAPFLGRVPLDCEGERERPLVYIPGGGVYGVLSPSGTYVYMCIDHTP